MPRPAPMPPTPHAAGHLQTSRRRWHLPTSCAVCRSWDVERLCRDCIVRWAAPVPRCHRCGIDQPELPRMPDPSSDSAQRLCADCRRAPPPFERCVAALSYGFPWDGLITSFKFHDGIDLAPTLATRLAEAVVAAGDDAVDRVMPVPLDAARLRERGYNQAWELSRRVARTLGLDADPLAMARVRRTDQQSRLRLADRAANVRGSFMLEPRLRDTVAGRRIALVDDVMTSGATVAEAAAELKRAGARSVHVWVLARTPHDGIRP